jgi:hypothetical protein
MTRLPARSTPAERTLDAQGVSRAAATVDPDDRPDEPLYPALVEAIGIAAVEATRRVGSALYPSSRAEEDFGFVLGQRCSVRTSQVHAIDRADRE